MAALLSGPCAAGGNLGFSEPAAKWGGARQGPFVRGRKHEPRLPDVKSLIELAAPRGPHRRGELWEARESKEGKKRTIVVRKGKSLL